jgi:hypothetical protein
MVPASTPLEHATAMLVGKDNFVTQVMSLFTLIFNVQQFVDKVASMVVATCPIPAHAMLDGRGLHVTSVSHAESLFS